ncbi:fatty acyl-AMP ligase [Streptomyces sp. NPDC004610]|uniref:fatty acyl-AMP ligase n=1 Tax=unclassified Streptomyces TaxID=2593676 RepID=UPI0033B6402B
MARTDPDRPRSVTAEFEALRRRSPDTPLLTYVDDDGRDTTVLTPSALAAAAAGAARELTGRGLRPGDPVLLCYPPSPHFAVALLACLRSGLLPVPVYPPNPLRRPPDTTALAAVARDCGAVAVLTETAYDRARTVGRVVGAVSARPASWTALPWYRTDRWRPLDPDAEDTGPPVPTEPDAPALLQYTSGSTGDPRGVVITHGNLWEETTANARDLGLGEGTRGVFWLPQYHDFGLISVLLSALSGNGGAHLLSPLAFLQDPAVWFDVMDRVRATHTAAPDFAYDLAVRRTTERTRSRWDLSSLRVVMSAAEPIRADAMDRFFDAFAVTGLRREAFYPAYGLAEHTVSVTMGGRARLRLDRAALGGGRAVPLDDRDADTPSAVHLGCGRVTKTGARLRIVDPGTLLPCEPGRVGEIWVDSPTKARGYQGRPEETRAVFRARVADGDPAEYLRTGDLGFLHDGELFVTGRRKDLIILGGRNLYPQDIEESVRRCHDLVRPGGIAAFAVPEEPGRVHAERLVVFVEVREARPAPEALDALAAAVRARVRRDHGHGCDLVIGTAGLVLKTTSGKVRRAACRAAHLDPGAGAGDAVRNPHRGARPARPVLRTLLMGTASDAAPTQG